MKRFFYVIFITILIAACTSTQGNMFVNCQNVKIEELITNLEKVLINNGFTINKSDKKNGILVAQKDEETEMNSGIKHNYQLDIKYKDNKIKFNALETLFNYNPLNDGFHISKIHHFDSSDKNNFWYWNVRNEIDRICNIKI